jgi:hypothetical protein
MPAQVVYAQPAPQQPLATFFGKLTTGQVIELVAGLFAMLQPLPAAPVATRDASTDIGNLVLLCRARHNRIYAARRIMPRGSRCSTEVHVMSAA